MLQRLVASTVASSSRSSIASSSLLKTATVCASSSAPQPLRRPPRRRHLSTTPRLLNDKSATSSPLARKYNTGLYDPLPALDPSGRIPSSPYDQSPLALSAPEYPKGHIIVHPYTQPRPQSTWPASIDAVCPIYVELGKRTKKELEGWGLSFSEGDRRATEAYNKQERGKEMELRFPEWDPLTPKVARPPPGDVSEDEEFLLHLYPGNGRHAVVGPYSLRTLPKDLSTAIDSSIASSPLPSARYSKPGTEEAHIYICTHGSRDCRCGVAGNELLLSLQAAVRNHALTTLQQSSPGSPPPKRVRIFPISHIGGHKYAANALVYPHGDWYGNLRESDTPLLLRAALGVGTSRHDLRDERERLVHWSRWRGRIGVGKEEMGKVWDQWGGGMVLSAVVTPRRRGRASAVKKEEEEEVATPQPLQPPTSTPEVEVEAEAKPQQEAQPQPQPILIPFRTHSGTVTHLPATLGETLKDVAVRNGIEEIEATCGGKCECATCHAYLVQPSAGPEGKELKDVDLNDAATVPGEEVLPEPKDEELGE